MANFQYHSREMRRALWAECLKDFDRVKVDVQAEAEKRLGDEIRKIIARFGIRMMEFDEASEMLTNVKVTIIEPNKETDHV